MSQTNLSDALAYARLGWHVFPCRAEDKAPLVSGGFHSASTSPEFIEDCWTRFPDAAIGVACGASKLFIIDLDVNHHVGQDGLMAWRVLCGERGLDSDGFTLAARTSRGGRHIVFRRPDVDKITTTNNIIPSSGIDVRGDGGYFIAPSACEPERFWDLGDPFEDAPDIPPAWLVGMVSGSSVRCGNPDGGLYNREMRLSQDEVDRIREALSFISCEDHDEWLRVGMALRSTGARNQALTLWAEWSQSSPKFDEKAMIKRWHSFREFRHDGSEIKIATLFAMARDGGWAGDVPLEFVPPLAEEPVAASPKPEEDGEEGHEPARGCDVMPFPLELMNFPGAVSDLASACLRNGRFNPHPSLAFGSALALISTVLNRRVRDEDNLMTQLYIALIGVTGSGKDANLKFPNDVLRMSSVERLSDRAGPSGYTSEAAFRAFLKNKPATLMARDEAGKWISQMMSDRASGADQSALAFVLSLYSTNYGQVLAGTQYANEKERETIDLHYPSVSILGASTPEGFYAGGGIRATEDGFANRFIVVHADELAPRKMSEEEESRCLTMEEAVKVVEEMDRFFGLPPEFPPMDAAGPAVEDAHVMRYTKEAKDALEEIGERNRVRREDPNLPVIERNSLARQLVNTKKVSLCFAAGQSLGDPVTLESVVAADKFVTWAMDRSIYESKLYVGASDFAVRQAQLMDLMKSRGQKRFTRGDVQKFFRHLRPRDIDEVLKSLGDAGDIGISMDMGGSYEVN